MILAVSYNQPKFCPSTTWNPNAITLANVTTVGSDPLGIFVNTNSTVYVADQANGRIQIWFNNSINPTTTISGNLAYPYSIFVTTNGDIYFGNSYSTYQVDKRTLNTNISVTAMSVSYPCYGLFVDISDNLYCSMVNLHQVVKRWLGDNATTLTTVAGTGTCSSASNMLCYPYGIFVDTNFDLYVADTYNNRIQLFRSGQLTATTVAGISSSTTTITLNCPTGIVLDADKYLYIVDCWNFRIVGSSPNGFRCLVGCSGSSGSASNQLYYPYSLSFDSYGNMFVTDQYNNRTQKFLLSTNSCGKYENISVSKFTIIFRLKYSSLIV